VIKGKLDKNNKARTVGKIKIDPARRSAKVEMTAWRRNGWGSSVSVFMGVNPIRRLKAQPN